MWPASDTLHTLVSLKEPVLAVSDTPRMQTLGPATICVLSQHVFEQDDVRFTSCVCARPVNTWAPARNRGTAEPSNSDGGRPGGGRRRARARHCREAPRVPQGELERRRRRAPERLALRNMCLHGSEIILGSPNGLWRNCCLLLLGPLETARQRCIQANNPCPAYRET